MGIDGQNILHIRGPKEILDALEASGCILPSKDSTVTFLNDTYFGEKCHIHRHSDRYMTVAYDFRNSLFYEYLTTLLELYPQCWLKNEFITELGNAGVWIARIVNGKPQAEEYEWTELTIEELWYLDDFSKTE